MYRPMGFGGNLRYGMALELNRPPAYPEAAVELAGVERGLNVYLHALAGSCRQKVVAGEGAARHRVLSVQRRWQDLVWQDAELAHLPKRIQRFSRSALNRDLYYWLAAYLAFDKSAHVSPRLPAGLGHLLRGVMTSEHVLHRCPGLRGRYARLCSACLQERVARTPTLRPRDTQGSALLESAIRHALGDPAPPRHPWLAQALAAAGRGEILDNPPEALTRGPLLFWPVALWGHPRAPESEEAQPLPEYVDPDLLDKNVGQPWTMLRSEPDYAEDPPETGGEALVGGCLYREWNCRRGEYRADWCRVREKVPTAERATGADPELQRLANRVRRRFEALRLQDRWQRRLADGEEVDLDAFVYATSERRGCGHASDRLYRLRMRAARELSVAVLLDVSNSTQGRVGESRVIDIAQQAMLVLAEALQELQNDFALYAFSSYGRAYVECLRIKDFAERYNDPVRRRVLALSPDGSTRIGAALRHVGRALERRAARHRLLLLLTDGRPYDPADRYEGRYALEDTRRALIDLRATGIYPFGLTIDQHGQEYLPYLFGPGKYLVFSNVTSLPESLPRLYARLTGLGK